MPEVRGRNGPLVIYIAANVLVAGLLLVRDARELTPDRAGVVAVWLLASIVAEWLWLGSITGQGSHSMASTFNYAAIFVLPRAEALWVVTLAVGVGAVLFQRRPWYRALFAAANVAIVVYLASSAFLLAGGRAATLEEAWTIQRIGPFLLVGLVFFLANTFGVATAIALSVRERLAEVWRKNFAYSFELLGTLALFLISPILVLTYLAIGPGSFVLFAIPLVVIRKGNRDYIDLQRTQTSVVAAERLAAKGEMAAGIAHELNNYLSALRGGTQLADRKLRAGDHDDVRRRLDAIVEQADRMAVLTQGLMDFAHREVVREDTSLTVLVEKTVAFLAPQPRFHGLEVRVSAPRGVRAHVDAGQIQQILVNLLHNAADAVREAPAAARVIEVRLLPGRKSLRLSVTDRGVGMSDAVRARLFEPTFTTKRDGHGFGLATCQRIAVNHGGRLDVDTAPGRGTTMTLRLPVARTRGGEGSGAETPGPVSRRAEEAPREPDHGMRRSGTTDD